MNVNEVLTNRALEILGKPRGDYATLSPNDHVNRGQSTNDTYPAAAQVAVLLAFRELRSSVTTLAESFRRKGEELGGLAKSGRTHLKDAMPVTLGAELRAYASALDRVLEALPAAEKGLAELPLGGSAVGTGVNTVAGFRSRSLGELARLTGLPLTVARDPFETMQSRWALGFASAWLRTLALELIRIANDLRLLSSGPATGFDEVRLPEIQPGSSIMPAKVNPSAAECLDMVAFHVVGADAATALAVQAGQLEINVMMPLAAYEVLFSAEILANYLPGLRAHVRRRDPAEPRTPRAVPRGVGRACDGPHAPARLSQGGGGPARGGEGPSTGPRAVGREGVADPRRGREPPRGEGPAQACRTGPVGPGRRPPSS